jgi:hypothetical protein
VALFWVGFDYARIVMENVPDEPAQGFEVLRYFADIGLFVVFAVMRCPSCGCGGFDTPVAVTVRFIRWVSAHIYSEAPPSQSRGCLAAVWNCWVTGFAIISSKKILSYGNIYFKVY